MNKIKFVTLISLVVFTAFCSQNTKNKTENIIDYNTFKIEKINKINYKDLGKIVKVVKLETTDKSVIGKINRVSIMQDKSILITDTRSSKKVFLFNQQGQYIRHFGKIGQGPGEYMQLLGATSIKDNIFLITAFKIIKFHKNGQYLKEIKINYTCENAISSGDDIYISGSFYNTVKKDNFYVLKYDKNLNISDGIGKYNKAIENLGYSLVNNLSKTSKNIAYITQYNSNIYLFDVEKKILSIIDIKLKKTLENILNTGKVNIDKKIKFSELTNIIDDMNHFPFVYGFKNSLLLWQICYNKKINNGWLINLKSKNIKIFPFDTEKDSLTNNILLGGLHGSYDKGVISELYIKDVKEFEVLKKEIPLLKDYEYDLDDNPIILFFEFF